MIPEAAVEAALSAIFPKGPISEFSRTTWERTVHEILEAAAPHMLERHEAAIRAVLAYGADREKYTDTGDPKVDAAIKSYAYHVRRVMSEAYEAAK